jgi:hypothetical protein
MRLLFIRLRFPSRLADSFSTSLFPLLPFFRIIARGKFRRTPDLLPHSHKMQIVRYSQTNLTKKQETLLMTHVEG